MSDQSEEKKREAEAKAKEEACKEAILALLLAKEALTDQFDQEEGAVTAPASATFCVNGDTADSNYQLEFFDLWQGQRTVEMRDAKTHKVVAKGSYVEGINHFHPQSFQLSSGNPDVLKQFEGVQQCERGSGISREFTWRNFKYCVSSSAGETREE